MDIEAVRREKQKMSSYDDLLQPALYGVLPNQLNDDGSLVDLLFMLVSQWKLILIITISGTLLAAMLALLLPAVYKPTLRVSVPSTGDIAVLATVDTILGGDNNVPSSKQAVFTNYYNLLRSRNVLAEYIHESNYLEKLYPASTEQKSILLAGLLKDLKVSIEEPAPERKGGYVANPTRLAVTIEVENEAIGVELLNDFAGYANKKLVLQLQSEVHEITRNKIKILASRIEKQKEQYRLNRVLTIKKMEQENSKEIALLLEQVSAYLVKAKANRATQIANAREALEMARSLGITYPTTLDAIAQKGKTVSTAITVVDKPSTSLYLRGTKYLSTLIETLTNRKNDEGYLVEVNRLKEKIHIIENDQVLEALKKRQSDDPWIEGLSEKLAEMGALKILNPDFTGVTAFSVDESAAITNEKIKPKRKLIVAVGFVLSLLIAVFAAIIVFLLKEKSIDAEKSKKGFA